VSENLDSQDVLPLPLSDEHWEAPPPRRIELFDEPPAATLAALRLQRAVGHLLLLPFAGFLVFLMRWVRGYRIAELRSLRRKFARIVADGRPLLICANHLTFIDSALMIWAFGSNWRYFFRFREFSWNLPAGDFFKKRLHFRLVAYLSKCIFIHRDGTKEHKDGVLAQCHWLLRRGEIISIFPEGRRSRIGRCVRERITDGVGKLLAAKPGCRALCVYLRGDKQTTFSDYPAKGSVLRLRLRLITPRTSASGRSAYADLAGQVADTIATLEREHFAEHGAPEAPARPELGS
jgi:hypothetical protein